jgi:hypothetical protein
MSITHWSTLAPIALVSLTESIGLYWLVTASGEAFAFGDAGLDPMGLLGG